MYEGYLSQLGLHDDFIYRIIIDDFNDQQLRRSAVIMTFLDCLGRAEGSINDATLIGYAYNGSFKVPPGRFFLADAGFGSRRGILIPFTRVRYYLQDWGDAAKRPVNEMEFNQIKIIYAVTGLYNFLAFEGKEPELGHEEEGLPSWEIRALRRARRRADMVVTGRSGIDMRSLIANWLWSTYQAYLELQNDSESEEIDEEGSVVEEVEDGDEIEVIAEEADQREAISSSQELD
ncbi:unnamed protein product [Fusarium fujikuroi]|uniref:DDE Tnp4 domain-containing protein n=1 Tax=Fusarium fujikuroi TaxID=5127 RepID=A0A9Q9U777_FUSFU|nr:unnamed protein product [Fusarium fujikuroi]